MVKAFSYKRFSSSAQSAGDSLRRQTEVVTQWLAANPSVVLDTSLAMTDAGISGYTGEHRNNPDVHALAAFVEAVRTKIVKPGDYLLTENLDRLTREAVQAGLMLCLGLTQAGIKIVQLSPVVMVYDDKSGPMELMIMIMELSRGHGESARKSELSGKAWGQKKKHASKVKVTKRCPGWLKLVGVKQGKGHSQDYDDATFEVIEKRAEVVRRMFALAESGTGVASICKRLNEDRIVNWGTRSVSKKWSPSTVYAMLTSRATIGEYQPWLGKASPKNKRKKVGEPIKDYYPAIIDADLFENVQGQISMRRMFKGRKSVHVNLFSGLLVDARDGGAIHAERTVAKPSVYGTANARNGIPGSVWSCFPLEGFDASILAALAEVRIHDQPEKDRLGTLTSRYTQVELRIKALQALLLQSDEMAEIVEAMRGLREERQILLEEMEVERQKQASPPSENLATLQTLIVSNEGRDRLQNAIRKVVSEIRCLFVGKGGQDRMAFVRISFHGSTAVRHYAITYRPARGGAVGQRDESFSWTSVVDQGSDWDIATEAGRENAERMAREQLRCR